MRHMLLDAQRFLKILFHLKKDSLGILISSARMVMRGWERGKEGVGRLFQDGFQVSAGSTPRPKKKWLQKKLLTVYRNRFQTLSTGGVCRDKRPEK